MISLCQTDAAFRRVQYYNPDLEVELLFLDEAEADEQDVVDAAHVRSALVARVADIVKQASNQTQALDAAVAIIEVLISSFSHNGERHGRGHKHAMQAIQLFASVSERFDLAIDLFFDLVERFCAQNRTQGKLSLHTTGNKATFPFRMLQNYDQTLVKLISKHWSVGGPGGDWSIEKAMHRIDSLRELYELRDDYTLSGRAGLTRIRMNRLPSSLFCESLKMLRSLQRTPTSRMMRSSIASYRARSQDLVIWARGFPHCIRSRFREEDQFGNTAVSGLGIVTYDGQEVGCAPQTISDRDAEIVDLKQQVQMLCSVIETNAHAKRIRSGSHLDSLSSGTLSDESDSLHNEKVPQIKVYHVV